jgi:hypothetical protein
VQEVRIDRERRFAALVLGDRDLMLLGEFNEPGARCQIPFAPGRDDADRRLERVIGQFESDLIIALAGRTMRHRIRADLPGDLDLLLRDERPRDRGAEKILPLIQCVHAEHREDEILHEFLAHILDEDMLVLDAEKLGFLARRL